MSKTRERSARYPIRAVARLTGIGIDTLRAWERRHQAVTPVRDDRGRMYTDADIARLRLLRGAVDHGHSIGRLAALTDPELRHLAAAGEDAAAVFEVASARRTSLDTAGLTAALQTYDAAAIDQQVSRLASVLPPLELLQDVLMPVLAQVGDEWHRGSVRIAHEHLTSSTMRNILGSFVRLYARPEVSTRLLFATPAGERHEIGTLGAAMLAASCGLGVAYLGPDLPAREIVDSVRPASAQVLVLGLTATSASKPENGNCAASSAFSRRRSSCGQAGAAPCVTPHSSARGDWSFATTAHTNRSSPASADAWHDVFDTRSLRPASAAARLVCDQRVRELRVGRWHREPARRRASAGRDLPHRRLSRALRQPGGVGAAELPGTVHTGRRVWRRAGRVRAQREGRLRPDAEGSRLAGQHRRRGRDSVASPVQSARGRKSTPHRCAVVELERRVVLSAAGVPLRVGVFPERVASTLAQPIGIHDVLAYLAVALQLPDGESRTFEIGGPIKRATAT